MTALEFLSAVCILHGIIFVSLMVTLHLDPETKSKDRCGRL
jgi:hypothetical protein